MRTAKTLVRLADSQADLSLRWAHTHFVGFVMLRLILFEPPHDKTNKMNSSSSLSHLIGRYFIFLSIFIFVVKYATANK